MTIYLVRHGQDDETVRGGWGMQGLTSEGQSQAEKLVQSVLKQKNELAISRILTSDLPRATQTAFPLAKALNIPLEQRPEFREVNNGELAGMKNVEADKKYPELWWSKLDWDETYTSSGESPHEFFDRISVAWSNLTKETEGKNIILVTHGGVIHVILSIINDEIWSNKFPKPPQKAVLIPVKFDVF